jgi:putative phage-type endonuclease
MPSPTTSTAHSFDPESRRGYLGASEAGAILGIDQYRTALDVYNEKLGLVPPFEGNAHTERGNRLEAVAADVYRENTGLLTVRRSQPYAHPQYPFIQGHIDRKVVGEKRILEIKCPSIAAFRSHQRKGLPDSYIAQAHVYMGLSGFPKLTWALFCADAWDLITFDVEFDETIYRAAVAGMVDFWNNSILTRTPPQPVDADKPAIEFAQIGGDVTVREDEEFAAAARTLAEAKALIADAKQLEELAKADLKKVLGTEYGRYECPGIRLHYSQVKGRRTFDNKKLAATHPQMDLEPFFKTGKPSEQIRLYTVGE